MEETPVNLVTFSEGPSTETWELHRPTITQLYLDEDKPLPQVKEIMQREHGFKATNRMYKRHLHLWKIDNKNLKRAQVKQIIRQKVKRDAVGKPSTFYIKQREVDMANIARYIKKRGFQTLESFEAATSPVVYSNEISCMTPGRSPNLHAMQLNEDEHPEFTQDAKSHSPYPSRPSPIQLPIAVPVPLSSSQRLSPYQNPSLSPVARLRRLLSLSPIPRALSVPEIWSVPERLLSVFSVYMKRSFESKTWRATRDGVLSSVKENHYTSYGDWALLCYSALKLLRQKKYVQSRQMLSQMFLGIESDMKAETPHFLHEFWAALYQFQTQGLHEISELVLSHSRMLAMHLLGHSHPTSQIFGMLSSLGSLTVPILCILNQCRLDLVQSEFGLWHPQTVFAQLKVLSYMSSDAAAYRARTLLESYEMASSKHNVTWFCLIDALATCLLLDGQYVEAEFLGKANLHAFNRTIEAKFAIFKKQTLSMLTRIAKWKNDFIEAEQYAQEAVLVAERNFGEQDSITLRCMLDHASTLRRLNRLQEADDIYARLDDLLGPPEIKELLE